MQESEKILEEINEYIKAYNTPPYGRRVEGTTSLLRRCANIIRKHMKSGKDTDVPTNDGWIPVEEALPPNVKHGFYPKYQVTTKHGVTEGWYDQYKEGWYVFTWFREFDGEVDFDKGNILKISFLSDEANRKQNILTAWQPFPEPYRSERSKDVTI